MRTRASDLPSGAFRRSASARSKHLPIKEKLAARLEAAEAKADASDRALQEMIRGVAMATRGKVGPHLGPMTREERRKILLGDAE